MWIVAAVAGVLVVVTGLLPLTDAARTLTDLTPVMVFLVGITVIAELASAGGVFEVAAHRAARWGRGTTLRLWLLVAVLGSVTTIALSLDTTAVLLTPVVLAMTSRLGLPGAPFAMLAVWLANTASLLLPVSNLTNLLLQQRSGVSSLQFAGQMWLPALVAIVVTVALLTLRYRDQLRGTYPSVDPVAVEDRWTFRAGAAVCLLFGTVTLAGVPVQYSAAVGAAFLVVVVTIRRGTSHLSTRLVPWRLVLIVTGLFLVVAAGQDHGLNELVARVAGTGSGAGDLLRLAGVGAGLANAVNNLPAFAILEPAATGGLRPYAMLLGVNLGPLVLIWGSLATMLWRERCRAAGVTVSWRELATVGIATVPVVVLTATAALVLG